MAGPESSVTTFERDSSRSWHMTLTTVVVLANTVVDFYLVRFGVVGMLAAFAMNVASVALLFRWMIGNLIRLPSGRWPEILDEIYPKRIALTPATIRNWFHPEEVADASTALESLGFEPAGDFKADKRPWSFLRGFVHPTDRMYGVIDDQHSSLGMHVELVTVYEDGSYLTCSSTRFPEIFDRPPNQPIERYPHADVATLHAKMMEGRPNQPMRVVTRGDWADVVMAYVAQEGRWRDADEEAKRQLQARIEATFLEKMGWSAGAWDQKRERVAFIHDRLRQADVVNRFDDHLYVEDEALSDSIQEQMMERVERHPPREAFAAGIALVPSDVSFEKLVTFETDVVVDAYLAPQRPEGWIDDA